MLEFYERAGYRVTTTPGAYWYVPGGRVWKNFPCGHTIAPSADEIAALARRRGMLGVEFFNARGIGVRSGLWMMRDQFYGLHSLQRQFRQHVERALEREQVREIAFGDLFRLGALANGESLARLGRDPHHLSDPQRWRRLCEAGAATPGAGALASFDAHGTLTAYLIHFVAGTTCYGLISQSVDAARHAGSNHALYFTYTHTMIRRPGIVAVSIGLQSTPPLVDVDRMKRHAGYRLESFDVAVVVRPAARVLLTSAAARLAIRAGVRVLGRTAALRRAEALREMIRATGDGTGGPTPDRARAIRS